MKNLSALLTQLDYRRIMIDQRPSWLGRKSILLFERFQMVAFAILPMMLFTDLAWESLGLCLGLGLILYYFSQVQECQEKEVDRLARYFFDADKTDDLFNTLKNLDNTPTQYEELDQDHQKSLEAIHNNIFGLFKAPLLKGLKIAYNNQSQIEAQVLKSNDSTARLNYLYQK